MLKGKFLLFVILIVIGALVAGLAVGCGGGSGGDEQESEEGAGGEELSGILQVNGSTTVAPVAQAWAEKFGEKHPEVDVAVSGTGSGNGIAALINGTTDIAMASRKMKPEEQEQLDGDPMCHVVGRDGLAVVVHPDNSVESLTMDQIKGIFTGEITNWNELGGSDAEILVYTRDTSSGTYAFFKEFVLDDEEYYNEARKTAANSNMAESISQEETAIGYVGLAFLDESIKAVGVMEQEGAESVEPSLETAKSGDYPIVRDLNMYTIGEPEGLAKEYLDYGFSEEGQKVVQEVGYIPVK